jgi:hypothetical protein
MKELLVTGKIRLSVISFRGKMLEMLLRSTISFVSVEFQHISTPYIYFLDGRTHVRL